MSLPVERIIYGLVIAVALAIFARNVWVRLRVLRAAQSTDRRGGLGQRILGVVVHVFGQARLLHGDFKAGLMHFFIFWGFVVLLLNSALVLLEGLVPGVLDVLRSGPGVAYLWLRDIFQVLVLLAVGYAMWRRLVTKPRRLTQSSEGILILLLIGMLMLTDVVMTGSLVHAAFSRQSGELNLIHASPIENWFYGSFGEGELPSSTAFAVFRVAKWVNLLTFFLFLNLLPLSKHFHVLLSPFNVYLRELTPFAKPVKLDLENSEEFGVSRIEQLHWKNWLDSYNCTECGRCDYFCPANATGKILSPQHIITGTREAIYAHTPGLLKKLAQARLAEAVKPIDGDGVGNFSAIIEAGTGESKATSKDEAILNAALVGEIHPDAALWACTTCGACDYHCPVFIEHVNPILEMRRHLVLEQEGRFPKELQTLFRGLETQANPWGLGAHTRTDWAAGLNVPTLEDNPDAEYLYYVGCFGSFDSRSKPTSVAIIELLNAAGVNYAVLAQETCNGDPARRSGNEYLAQMLADQLIGSLQEIKPRKVITQCPHCFNAFRSDYPDYGFVFEEVIHHSELLARLVRDGKLKPTAEVAKLGGAPKRKVVFHDSCYLGRYNEVYSEPRATLKSVPGVELVEAKFCGDKGYCCGAGGGRMFMEETEGRRVNEFRYEQLAETGADEVAVACPYCMTMIDDASKVAGGAGQTALPVRDIALVLRDAVIGQNQPVA